ncbi:hypothetical protein CSQ96_27915 [Janthinobacterium sp. BJB412]|nr:hypothetical protein CSQ96_27915 [Janthinobacterium sp. BJB412]
MFVEYSCFCTSRCVEPRKDKATNSDRMGTRRAYHGPDRTLSISQISIGVGSIKNGSKVCEPLNAVLQDVQPRLEVFGYDLFRLQFLLFEQLAEDCVVLAGPARFGKPCRPLGGGFRLNILERHSET